MTTRTCAVGEALIDVMRGSHGHVSEHVGGSPLNVAQGMARLGHAVDFATTFGDDARGRRIAEQLAANGVTVLPGAVTAEPTSTAVAELDAAGAATYHFDLHWNLPPVTVAPATGHVHTGSIAAMLRPGDDEVLAAVSAARERGTVSYDPNIRPTIMGDTRSILARVTEIIAMADVVKASSDDLDVLYPGETAAQVLARWCDAGASLAVVTLGAHGVAYRTRGSQVATAPTRAQRVTDTVGAGDSFMAGLLSGLLDADLLGSTAARDRLAAASADDVAAAIDRALACAAVTVGHAGAYAPTRQEL